MHGVFLVTKSSCFRLMHIHNSQNEHRMQRMGEKIFYLLKTESNIEYEITISVIQNYSYESIK